MIQDASPPKIHTYQDLANFHFPGFEGKSDFKNIKSAMERFLRQHGKTWKCEIGHELGPDFLEATNIALDGLAESSQPAFRSRLGGWQASYFELVKTDGLPIAFTGALRIAIEVSGLSYEEVTRASGLPGSTLRKWWDGRNLPPIHRSTKARKRIESLERELNLSPNTLLSRLPHYSYRKGVRDKYGDLLLELRKVPYSLNVWPENLEKEWQALYQFHTRAVIRAPLKRNSKWRIDKHGKCPTAKIARRCLSEFFGFLCLSEEAEDPRLRGRGRSSDELSFFQLTDIDLICDYIEFRKIRTNAYNSGTKNFLGRISSLIHPDTGFVIQHATFGMSPDESRDHFVAAHQELRGVIKQIAPLLKKTRDPEKSIRPILDLQHPIDALLEMNVRAMEDFRRRFNARKINETAARKYRDIFLINMLTANPLRVKNYSRMTYREDGNGHLRKKPDGGWWLEIPKEEFKNEQGAAKDKDYRVQIDEELWPMIDSYLCTYRPLLQYPETDFVFLNTHSSECRKGKKEQEASLKGSIREVTLATICRDFTFTYCPVSISRGFRTHAFRHIVVTDYLKNHPDGVEVASAILHDRPETVRRSYAHLLVYDRYAHYQGYLTERRQAAQKREAEHG